MKISGKIPTLRKLIFLAGTAALIAGCGGGSEPVRPAPQQTIPRLTITNASLANGTFGQFYSATLQASGGSGPLSWFVVSGSVPPGLDLDHEKGILSGIPISASFFFFTVAVEDSAGRIDQREFRFDVDRPPAKIFTTKLPDARLNQEYQVGIMTTGLLQMAQGSTLPPGLFFNDNTLMGRPTQAGSFDFTVVANDPGGNRDQRAFQLNVRTSLPRNDDTASAVPLSSGTYLASISPFGDPVSEFAPDNDYYKITAQPGKVVSVEILAETKLGTPLDSVIEFVNASGTRLTTCDEPGASGFTSACMNDDNLERLTFDSRLLFKATGDEPVTFFVHVLDFRGDARPDMKYELQIFGAD